MKIGFSGKIFSTKLSGNGYYLYRLLQSLLRVDKDNQYTLFLPGNVELPEDLADNKRLGVSLPSVSLNRRGLRAGFEAFYVPYMSGRLKNDILHMPTDGGAYWVSHGCLVVSLMGIAARHFPHIHPAHIRLIQRWSMSVSAKNADLIFTISESSKRDLVEMFGVSPEKIKVTYLGVDEKFSPRDRLSPDATRIREKYNLPKRFILFLGNLEPRKNIISLIRAFSIVQSRDDIELVIAGRKAWMYDAIFQTSTESEYREKIHFTGYVDDADLPWLYAMADVFVFPSLFEGFGLPNLEAMACGTPVISSNLSSIPEVVGNAGMLVNPTDIREIADAISTVISDRQLSERLSSAGIYRASQFTWERTALQTLDGYRYLFGGK